MKVTNSFKTAWTRSKVDELIAALWIIAAIICFGFKFYAAGWYFVIKAALDGIASIWFGFKERKQNAEAER